MSKDTLIALDMDGIIVDMLPAWVEALNQRVGTTYSMADVTSWDFGAWPEDIRSTMWEILNEDHFLLDMPPIEGAVEAVREIHEAGAKVIVVTAPVTQSKTAVWDKQQWLEKHLPFLGRTKDYAIYAHAKHMVRDDSCLWSVFVDDRDKNLVNAVTLGGYTMATGLRYKYNEHVEELGEPISLFDDWSEMKEFILRELALVEEWKKQFPFYGEEASAKPRWF